MTRGEAVCVPPINVPTGADIATVTQVGRVESQAGDDGKGVTAACVDGDPPAATAFAITEKITRWQRRLEKIGMMQREGNGPRAVVAIIVERALPPAQAYGFTPRMVARQMAGLQFA